MKKVLILSYFFPPCNLTASQRALGWAKYMKKYGYYPVIVTRNWDNPISTPTDVLKPSGSKVEHIVTDEYEVYYLPYKGSLRDRLFARYGESRWGFLRRILTFFELFFENFFNSFIPFNNIYEFSEKYIDENNDVTRLVITANPFTMFRFGYLLNKKTGIRWLADYRDDWNTSEFIKNKSLLERILFRLKSYSEKKWVATASLITSVSEAYVEKIQNFVGVEGKVILNGYFEEVFNTVQQGFYEEFTIVYNGSLYETQPVEIFLNAYKRFIDNSDRKAKIKIYFPGLLFDKVQANRVASCLQGYEEFVKITPRIPQPEVFTLQANAHLLLMVAHTGIAGVPSSKLYEYIGFGKPIMICPPDGDIIENTLKGYNVAYLPDTEDKVLEKLNELYLLFENYNYNSLVGDFTFRKQYTREHGCKQLVEFINDFDLPTNTTKNVIILAHDFPPYTSIGALRPNSWYKYFLENNIYPIVITRQWDYNDQSVVNILKPSAKQYVSKENTSYGTVIRLPYQPNIRDKFIIKNGLDKYNFIRRSLTFFYSVAKFLSGKYDNTYGIYIEAAKLIKSQKIDAVIATGEPFILFKYAYYLAKRFNVKWIADYRDGWTTNSVAIPRNIVEKSINRFFESREEEYLTNVSMITNASPTYATDFKVKYPNKKVNVIFNGYDEDDNHSVELISQNNETFTITYAGILYPYHKLEMFLDAYALFVKQNPKASTRVIFLGIEFYPEQRDRILNYNTELNKYIITTPRIPHKEVFKELRRANILLLLSDENAKSLHAKIFEYMLAERKIYLVKNDKGVLESILKECNAGEAFSDVQSIVKALNVAYKEFLEKGYVTQNTINPEKYSRRYQAKELANLIISNV